MTVGVRLPWPSRMDHQPMLVLSLSLLAAALVWFDGPPVLRLPVGLIAALLLPGYSLHAILGLDSGDLGIIEHLALDFVLSLAVIAILALGLNYAPWGLTPISIVLVLTVWTCLTTAGAWWRQVGCSSRSSRSASGRKSGSLQISWAGVTIATATLVVVAVSLAFTVNASPPQMTEFFVLGQPGLAEGYPRIVEPGDPITITLGITNREDTVVNYRVALETDTSPLVATGPVELGPGATWYGPVTFSLPRPGKNQEIRFVLHKDDAVGAYRQLSLWIDSDEN
jgi:uncharacterized membrane protein